MKMSRFITYLILALVLFTSNSCKKGKRYNIVYSEVGSFGPNILALPDGSVVENYSDYSLQAVLGKKATLKIKITRLSGTNATWFYGDEDGWTGFDYINNTQEFKNNDYGTIEAYFLFANGPGSCRIDFYENSSTVTNSKTFSW